MANGTYALAGVWAPVLSSLRLPLSDALRACQLPDDLLRRPDARLPADDFHQLWQRLEDAHGAERLALDVCAALRPASFSPSLFATLVSPNLCIALGRLSRFKRLVAPMSVTVEVRRNTVHASVAWDEGVSAPPVSLVATELLLLVQLARAGTARRIIPERVVMAGPLAARFEPFLGIPMRSGAQASVTFTRGDAEIPFRTANDALWEIFEPALRSRLATLGATSSLRERVAAALRETLPAGLPQIEVVGQRLAMSPRSLQRHLADEGTSYTAVLRDVRIALARHYLTATPLAPMEIALLLGYDEMTSFARAFRGWLGTTPRAYRDRARSVAPSTARTLVRARRT